MNFKAGDKIEVVKDFEDNRDVKFKRGDIGVIKRIWRDGMEGASIEWEKKHPDFYSCDGDCKNGHGWQLWDWQIEAYCRKIGIKRTKSKELVL